MVTLTTNTISMVTLFVVDSLEIRSDEFYIPGFSIDELDIIVSTSSTM